MCKPDHTCPVFALILLVVGAGCVTPPTVKDASTRQTSNLSALEQAALAQQKLLQDYYRSLIDDQRQAHVAYRLGQLIDDTALAQSESVYLRHVSAATMPAVSDFIRASVDITDQYENFGQDFDKWMDKYTGGTVAAKKQWLQEQAKLPENADIAGAYLHDAALPDKELRYVDIALSFRKEASLVDQRMSLLLTQIRVMERFHAVVDKYLATDATIDGQKIAEAAAAGSNFDLSKLPDLKQVVDGAKGK